MNIQNTDGLKLLPQAEADLRLRQMAENIEQVIWIRDRIVRLASQLESPEMDG